MKTITKIVTATSLALFVAGCGPKIQTVQVAESNMDIGKLKQVNNSGNAHLLIHLDNVVFDPVKINIDNKVFDSLSNETHAYYEVSSGRHWIAALGGENSSFMCKQFEANRNYIYEIDTSMGIMHPRVHLKESSISKVSKESKQVQQKNKKVSKPLAGTSISSITVVGSNDENTMKLASKVQERLQGLSISSGNGMTIKLSLLGQEEGNQLGRYMFGGMQAADNYKSSVTTKAEFYIGNKKVDELISYKELSGGLLGGSNDGLTSLIADEVTSYLACKYYAQQYPKSTK